MKKTLTCKCGAAYETGYWMSEDEQISKPAEMCRRCQTKLENAERIKAAEARLPEIIEAHREQWIDESGLPGKYFFKTFENFNSKLQPGAFEKSKAYNGDKSLVLSSPDLYGVGKTHLIAAMMNKIVNECKAASVRDNGEIAVCASPVLFTSEAVLLNRIRATYNRHDDDDNLETESDIFKSLHRIDHLFIDDVGKVRPKDYSFLQGVYYQIIDGRYCAEMPIVLTTNLSFAELENHIGGACADRLREMCGKENLITMTGKSQRK